MDCPSEENLIRMKLSENEIEKLEFNIADRKLTVYHRTDDKTIEIALDQLDLGSKKLSTDDVGSVEFEDDSNQQKSLLWTVLAINFVFFVLEIIFGVLSNSMGLVADSLDMLADSSVYGLSLFAVGATLIRKKRIAKAAGYMQLLLAFIGFYEVIRRFVGLEETPDFKTMIIVSIFALIANGICLRLLQQSKSEDAHMKASMIFTSNDIIINLGVIAAGLLVFVLNSNYPDLIIGAIVFMIVFRGAFRILKLGK
ncbi:MAG: cation diffusion facilitator family transporter [Crocinitomicaceae bacterium]|jgi:cation diffusion facilitator family transporter